LTPSFVNRHAPHLLQMTLASGRGGPAFALSFVVAVLWCGRAGGQESQPALSSIEHASPSKHDAAVRQVEALLGAQAQRGWDDEMARTAR
jgi:hypothetical protein